MALTGVEPSVGGEIGINGDGHQTGRPADEQIAEIGGDGLDCAVSEPTAQHARPLGEQHRPVGCEGDTPRVIQAGDVARRW